jgi:recombination DNA repair RAD52 pathway protein
VSTSKQLEATVNKKQYEQLLKPLNETRVSQREQAGRKFSYLEAWDVKAHLIRIFGFGGWSWTVTTAELAFEDNNNGKWNVGYKVIGTLTIACLDCTYSEAAVGSATLGSRGDAHDMAIKSGESDALKRAAINLGTQFGLSLYKNGSLQDVVKQTLDRSDDE